MEVVTLALVAHTNVGKTTLARTLLRKDVGEVRDAAHVTVTTETHVLCETPEATLRLADTPGFGDTARLVKRLRGYENPVGWFLHEVWDRYANKPLWCSQQAMRSVQEESDAVLYLVNASESPEDAGYLRHEFEILGWIARPVLLILNQTGQASAAETERLIARWREYSKPWPIIRDVFALDAFTRCWTEEGVLLDRVALVLPEAKARAMRTLRVAWDRRNREIYRRSLERLTDHLLRAAGDRVALDDANKKRIDKKAAMQVLTERLEKAILELMNALLADHGLDGSIAVRIDDHLRSFALPSDAQISTAKGAIIGGVLSGAITGLVTDLLAGGLTFGGGLVAGMIGGAVAGAGLAKGYQMVGARSEPSVSWSKEGLADVLRDAVSRYIATAHFGRGRGGYQNIDLPSHWIAIVDRAVAARATMLERGAKFALDPAHAAEARLVFKDAVASVVRDVLIHFHPEAAPLLAGES